MGCLYPQFGWYSAEINPSGKRSVTFRRNEALVDRPVTVPCGKCVGCRADQALAWSIRCYHEASQHEKNCFVTLTYEDSQLPSDGKIQKEELQRFFKRLRRSGYKFRYFACGEYGEKTRRPHYHAIIFGQDFLFDKISINDKLYTSPTLQERWGKGLVSIASVELHSIMYVCGYTQKKLADPDTFTLCSRKPMIGHDWLIKYHNDLVRTGKVVIDGREFVVPKRYLDVMPDEFIDLKEERKLFAQAQPYDPLRLHNKEVNQKWKINQKNEKI